ncbi:hypothetical protein LEM8419_01078 [Neolewinella maritima]|uniref:Uncharacterized protein n=1 Tax=Neolewinella maritima TaxID=1383882 RepID=A0ABM9AYI6_9BACT|nr:hypothetical protein [Neolewinella maritima]CAH0999778.1 hypothetical protein LEM8419_01078 [Neolewinella maritima]
MPRTKLTGFSRLLIFLLFALPIVYAGAAYYNGEDPVANVKGWLGMDQPEQVDNSDATVPSEESYRDAPATFENVQELREENDRLRRELARCQGTTAS